MTNGGVSKATKSLHVSEDVFGGYNVMLRGRDITYVDYHAVGKGRDMGFETILAFEGKVGPWLGSKCCVAVIFYCMAGPTGITAICNYAYLLLSRLLLCYINEVYRSVFQHCVCVCLLVMSGNSDSLPMPCLSCTG